MFFLCYILVHHENPLEIFVQVVSEIYKKALKVQILNKVILRQVVRKRVSF